MKRGEEIEDFLHELDGWERAYPLSAFPEPDLGLAAEVLKKTGLTLDAVSAFNMRHVISQIAPKARAAIESARREAWNEAVAECAKLAEGHMATNSRRLSDRIRSLHREEE